MSLVDTRSWIETLLIRYGLMGENGSGKSTFLQSLAERDIDIPEHIDVRTFF